MDRSSLLGGAGIGAVVAALAIPRGGTPSLLLPAALPVQVVSAPASSAPPATQPFVTGADLLQAFYSTHDVATRRDSLNIIIATVADPISSHLDWSYDAELGALRRAFEHSGYVIDRYWLPWRSATDTAAANRGLADAYPATRVPGVMLFRRRDPRDSRVRLVYLVGEVPTSGIHSAAFRAALTERWTLLAGAQGSGEPIRIVGPNFSGSSNSLRRAIEAWRSDMSDDTPVEIVTGSASDAGNAKILDLPRVRFSATVHTSERLTAVAESVLVGRLGLERAEIAFLHEGTTQFGSVGVLRGDSAGKTPDDRALSISFPMNISGLRVQYARHPDPVAAGSQVPVSPNLPRLALDQREPASLTESPAVMSQLTAPGAEILLDQIERTLVAHHIRAVGVLATDIRDELFLASEIKKRLRDAQLFFLGSNSLLLRPDFANALRGSLVFSTYPLFPENQYWDLTRKDAERLMFSTDEAEGVFNAVLRQLGNDSAMAEYVAPIDTVVATHAAAPPTWVTIVGENGMYPVTAIPASDRDADAAYVSHRLAGAARRVPERARHVGQFLLALLLLVAGSSRPSSWFNAERLRASIPSWPPRRTRSTQSLRRRKSAPHCCVRRGLHRSFCTASCTSFSGTSRCSPRPRRHCCLFYDPSRTAFGLPRGHS